MKRSRGIANAADNHFLHILLAPEKVHQAVFFVVSHGVHREIPAFQILGEKGGEGHFLRVAAVLIFPVQPVGRHLVALPVQKDRHGPVLDSRIDSFFEKIFHLLRKGRGRDVPVVGRPSQETVPDATAHRIGLKPMLLQNR